MRNAYKVLLLVVALALSFTSVAQAEFPEREITLVVPVAAGGGSDMTMRALARETERILGVPVVIVNRVGAGGAVGLNVVANAKPDGYTLVMMSEYNYNLPMTQQVPFSLDSFVPIATVNFDPASIAVAADSPWKSLDDMIDYAAENPGVVTIGNSGFGNIWHIAATAFEQEVGAGFTHVPFVGAAPTITATLGGHISAMVASPPELSAQVKAGEMRILAVMSQERSTLFPDVPTLQELGYDLQFGTWRGVGAPAGTPDEILDTLEAAFRAAVESEGFRSFMETQGLGILWRDRDEMAAFMQSEAVRMEGLLRDMGLLRN